ncbi:MAG: class A beta-lactamase-related serine hydrolase [Candidatus Falkowbacteria bacterium]|nr:class A beta-lactamase-related serine hydrolase [Candidatus Falkowbacteria bacterium]
MIKRFIIFIVSGVIILGIGISIGYYRAHFLLSTMSAVNTQPAYTVAPAIFNSNDDAFPFINPTVTSNLGKHFIINFKPLKEQMTAIQKKYPQHTYIYFSYLNNSSWVGINERDLFVSASTIKVPLTMAVLKAEEDNKLKLADKYALEELDLDGNFGELYQVGSDKELSVEELIKIMLEKSDNTAMRAIINILNKIGINDPFVNVYEAMGWDTSDTDLIPEIGKAPNYQAINLKTLSNMFIALYDSKYINTENSNRVLEYLANTPFNDKIVAGVPKDILVAHKIGISVTDNTFSDCGIVYAPNRNYILCLGSSGADEANADKFMAEISKVVYQFVINN